ncbi:MAG TPA: hypothetical protein VFS21_09180 [Roseiflexaceae bacterium]|nr:hypothetical protein [Roseiflexaceae bacterium]
MKVHFKEGQSLQEQWPHIRAQLLPLLDGMDPRHAVYAIRRALEADYGAVAGMLGAAVAAAPSPSRRLRALRLLYSLLDALALSGLWLVAAALFVGLDQAAQGTPLSIVVLPFAPGPTYGARVAFWLALLGMHLHILHSIRRRSW